MKINELIKDVYTTNAEKDVLEEINHPTPLSSFNEREQVIINNLVRKSLISKVNNRGHILVMKNETYN
jgi:hypothetical protein